MVLASGAEDIGSDVAGGVAGAGGGGSNDSGRNFGLTGGQKAAAAGRLLPKPRTSHPYIVGLSLVAIGLLSLVGSITGTLPSMIAALFVPNALGPSATSDVPVPIIGDPNIGIPDSTPALPPGDTPLKIPEGGFDFGFE